MIEEEQDAKKEVCLAFSSSLLGPIEDVAARNVLQLPLIISLIVLLDQKLRYRSFLLLGFRSSILQFELLVSLP